MSRLLWRTMFALAAATALMAAQGVAAASKPAYCSNVSDLEQSLEDDLKGVTASRAAPCALQTDVKTVQSNADAVVSSAKQDFPSGPSALLEIIRLEPPTAVTQQVSASPTGTQAPRWHRWSAAS